MIKWPAESENLFQALNIITLQAILIVEKIRAFFIQTVPEIIISTFDVYALQSGFRSVRIKNYTIFSKEARADSKPGRLKQKEKQCQAL